MSGKNTDILNFLIRELSEGRSKETFNVSLREYLIKRRAYLRDEVLKIQERVEEIDELLELYDYKKSYRIIEDGPEMFEEKPSEYSKLEWNDANQHRTKEYWRAFAMHIFEASEMMIASSEIMSASSAPMSERRQAMSILSNVLSELVKENKVYKIKIEGERGYYYGLMTTPPVKKN